MTMQGWKLILPRTGENNEQTYQSSDIWLGIWVKSKIMRQLKNIACRVFILL